MEPQDGGREPKTPQSKPPEPGAPKPKLPDFTGWIVLVAVLGLIALGLYAFPLLKGVINYQDCVGSGRTDCGRNSGG